MTKIQRLDLRCPGCGGTKFHLENPNLHIRNLKNAYRAADGSINAEFDPERVEEDKELILWCSNTECNLDFCVTGWDENEVILELLDEMESAGQMGAEDEPE